MAEHKNRLADDDDESEKRDPRTPAQQSASRKNGAKSRGPVTQAGKAISSKNAWKHGLLARKFTPQADSRGDHKLYKIVYMSLVDELRPETFSDNQTIAALASDYVQVVRARRMLEILQRPAPLNSEDSKKWRTLKQRRRDAKLLNGCAKSLEGGKLPRLNQTEATKLAQLLGDSIDHLQGEIDNIAEEGIDEVMHLPMTEDDQIELKEIEELKARFNAIGEARERLRDNEYIVRVLSGKRKPEPGDQQRLLAEFRVIVDRYRTALSVPDPVSRTVKNSQDQVLLKLAGEPSQLMLLQRYMSTIERRIERRTAKFRKRRRPFGVN